MTDAEELSRQSDEDARAIVEAFIDGELVTCNALRDALADAAARDHLVDLLVLRREVAGMAPVAWATTGQQPVVHTRARWLALAAAVLLSLATGYLAGQHRAIDAPLQAQTVDAVAPVERPPAAPKPTRVIKLEAGVNWTERSGGH
jgi:hypothetical protein